MMISRIQASGRVAAGLSRRGRWRGLLAVLLVTVAAAEAAPRWLVIASARDTTAGFVALPLTGGGRQLLGWPEGVVATDDTVTWHPDGPGALAFALGESAAGGGAAGRFTLADGRYTIDTPLYLEGGGVTAFLAAGSLEVTADRLTYRRPAAREGPTGDYLLLAGIVVATGVLLHLARRRRGRA
jgi:hypothetical protein